MTFPLIAGIESSMGGFSMRKHVKSYLMWILLCEGMGVLAAFLAKNGIAAFRSDAVKPPFSPPGILFPVVWTILYALMGISAARIILASPNADRSAGLNLFIGQLTFQFFWTLIFFNGKNYGLALFWIGILWVLIALMILSFQKTDTLAALLQIPYLLWATFAFFLNAAVWKLNWNP